MKRNTIQRQIILEALNDMANHPTAEEVYLHVIKTHPTISKATVYRNLASSVEEGEISTPGIYDGAMRFDHIKNSHFHFVCDKCKKIIDVKSFDLKKNLPPLKSFKINKVELTLRGLCPDCQQITIKEKQNG